MLSANVFGALRLFCGLCPAPAKKLFEKSFLVLQKLLKIGAVYHRHGANAPYNKNTALTSFVQAHSVNAVFLLLVTAVFDRCQGRCDKNFSIIVGTGVLDGPLQTVCIY